MKTIEIVIDKQGQTVLQTHGFSGPSCREASKFLEQALGATTTEQLTSEFYQAANIEQRQQQRN